MNVKKNRVTFEHDFFVIRIRILIHLVFLGRR